MSEKNIVICSDGTGNTAVKGRGTNVFKLYEAVDVVGHLGDPSKREQVAIYDDGIGTQRVKLIRALAGAFGIGLARNVRQLYTELVRSYTPDDDIYMFGFSRGAFTVRTLAGFVNRAGILDPADLSSRELNAAVGDLYRAYRKKKPAVLERVTTPLTNGFRWLWHGLARLFSRSKKKTYTFRPADTIKFVGVWDTVDAVGFPIPGVAWVWNHVVHRFKFTDPELPACVERARHALAIDEERASFAPSLWTHDPERTEQVWFAGVHSNVGGGYPKQGMSLVTLDWMMGEAELANRGALRFTKGLREQYREGSNVGDYLYDSRSGPSIYYRYRPRNIKALCEHKKARVPVRIHHTAIGRIQKRTRGYAPGNLPGSFEIVGAAGDSMGSLKPSRKFSGANGFWKWWRQTVQVAFYFAQAGLLWLALSNSPVPDNELPKAPDSEQASEAGEPTAAAATGDASTWGRVVAWVRDAPDRLVPWLMGVAENAVAPVPGDFVQKRVVQPMFAHPKIGLPFVLVFPLCYFLGLIGRIRQEDIDSNAWRHVRLE